MRMKRKQGAGNPVLHHVRLKRCADSGSILTQICDCSCLRRSLSSHKAECLLSWSRPARWRHGAFFPEAPPPAHSTAWRPPQSRSRPGLRACVAQRLCDLAPTKRLLHFIWKESDGGSMRMRLKRIDPRKLPVPLPFHTRQQTTQFAEALRAVRQ